MKDKIGAVKNNRRRSIVGELIFVPEVVLNVCRSRLLPHHEMRNAFFYIKNLVNKLDFCPGLGYTSRTMGNEICK